MWSVRVPQNDAEPPAGNVENAFIRVTTLARDFGSTGMIDRSAEGSSRGDVELGKPVQKR